jgi:hypothetical protein
MGKQVRITIHCDVCGRIIEGDYMVVKVDGHKFYICRSRTAPINPCGNKAKRKLLEIFKKCALADALIEDLNLAD